VRGDADTVVTETTNPVVVFGGSLQDRIYLPPADVDFSVLARGRRVR
jgi:uncharacterized protein (DUF427 family)